MLEKGTVVEFGPPVELMEKDSSAFRALCMAQGHDEYERLRSLAGKVA